MDENTPIPGTEVRISGDSHVAEPLDLWEMRFPDALKDRAPRYKSMPVTSHTRAGGWDPALCIQDMAVDSVAAEVLYPSLGGRALDLDESEHVVAEAIATVYNDWLSEYCSYSPERLWGLAVVPLWDIDFAVKELQRTRRAGMVGASIWMAPPDDLPFYAPHYEPFWAAAEELGMPVSLHINTGFGPFRRRPVSGTIEGVTFRAHGHAGIAQESLAQILLSGVLERHPRLRVGVAEVNTGWVPFWLQELDENYQRYVQRSGSKSPEELIPLEQLPSEYFESQCFSTFMDDSVAGYLAGRWWHENALWGNDYPHWNGIWPNGTEILNRTLAPLSPERRYDVVCGNVARLYGKPVPPPLPKSDFRPSEDELPARIQRQHVRNARI